MKLIPKFSIINPACQLSFRLVPVIFFALLLVSCNKITGLPIPGGAIPFGIVTPVRQYINTYNIGFSQTQPYLDLSTGGFDDAIPNGTTYQQAEIGIAFRTSVPGVVFELGIWLPDSSYVHTVTLWDSATQTILAQKNVYNYGKNFSYDTLSPNELVTLQPNHGYVLGVNSLALGNPLNAFNAGNEIFFTAGLTDFNPAASPNTPATPMTEGPITVETGFIYNYGILPTPSNPFPPVFNNNSGGLTGLCDFGFAQ
jgi:hypothetical protein